MSEMNIYAGILIDEARRRGIKVEEIDCRFNLYALSYGGKKVCCRESLTEQTSAYTMTICSNKWLTLKFLRESGLRVPRQELYENESKALSFLKRLGSALVVKPLNGEQGRGITVGVNNKKQLKQAVNEASSYDSDILLEEYVEGRDLRVIVIDYHFVAAIERVPATVIGDGSTTLAGLIKKRNEDLQQTTAGESQIPLNQAAEELLREQGYLPEDVPPADRKIQVCRLANFHSGGTIEDVTPLVSVKLQELAEKAARVLNIPVVGLDFLIKDLNGENYVIIEANERPGLANHEPQPTAERFIDYLFPETAGQGD